MQKSLVLSADERQRVKDKLSAVSVHETDEELSKIEM